MNHPCAANFMPARFAESTFLLADLTGTMANVATEINFERRLGKLEMKRPNAAFCAWPVKFFSEIIQGAFKVLDIDSLINNQAFKLMKHLGMGDVLLSAVAAGNVNNSD